MSLYEETGLGNRELWPSKKPAQAPLTLSIRELVTPETIVLVDRSAQEKPGDSSVCWGIYDAKRFSHLNVKELIRARRDLQELAEIFSMPHVYAPQRVINEFAGFVKHIGAKLGYLSKAKGRNHPSRNAVSDLDESASEAELRGLHEQSFALWEAMKHRDFRKSGIGVDYQKLGAFVDMIKILDRAIGLKRDINYLRYGTHERDESHDKDTDERITAAILYLSMFQNKKPLLLSCDSDSTRILRAVPEMIGSPDFLPANSDFVKAMKENPARMAHKEGGGYTLCADTANRDYSRNFEVRRASEAENAGLKKRIADLWKAFC